MVRTQGSRGYEMVAFTLYCGRGRRGKKRVEAELRGIGRDPWRTCRNLPGTYSMDGFAGATNGTASRISPGMAIARLQYKIAHYSTILGI